MLQQVTITMTGPATVWFAVGINAPNHLMADAPYTLIVNDTGEYSLALVVARLVSCAHPTITVARKTLLCKVMPEHAGVGVLHWVLTCAPGVQAWRSRRSALAARRRSTAPARRSPRPSR